MLLPRITDITSQTQVEIKRKEADIIWANHLPMVPLYMTGPLAAPQTTIVEPKHTVPQIMDLVYRM
jgi:hypothetical protein